MTTNGSGQPDQPAHPDARHGENPVPGAAVPTPDQPAAQQYAPAQQQPAWALPPAEERTVETEPLEYHRLYRGIARYRWWKPLLAILLATAFYVTFSVIVSGVWVGIVSAQNPDLFTSGDAVAAADALTKELALDTQNPFAVFMNLITIILMIPSVVLAMLCLGMRPIGRIWSVACRIRWGLLGRTAGIAVIAVVVMNGVGMLAGALLDPADAAEPLANQADDFSWSAALLSMLIVLILVPFQATAEEVVFRGMAMQVIGAWLKNPWFAIIIPSIGFALAHIYDVWGMSAVGLMGLVAAWLTWKTGGLEAAISIHVINNIAAFGLMAAGVAGDTAQVAESGGPATLIGEIAGLAVYVWLVTRSFTKQRLGRSRIDLVRVWVPIAPAAQAAPIQGAGA